MNEFYTKMLEMHGSNCVWEDADMQRGKAYYFTMGNSLMDDLDGADDVFEEYCKDNTNISCIGPQDEVMNCVMVKDCDLLDEVEMKFIEEWVGSNCYNDW